VGHCGVPVAVSGGLHGILLNHVARGVTSLCGRSAGDLVRLCSSRSVHELHLTPYAARATLRHLTGPQSWTRSVKIIRMVGGPVPPAVAQQLSDAFPQARVISLYGLTEGGAAAFVKVVDGRSPGSIGRPMVGTQARIVDSDGRDVAVGEVGEVAVRATGTTTLSYYGEDALTRTWFPGGWARTGDLGYLDDSGAVRLVGRVKEMIFLKGGRISPDALEELLAREIPDAVEFAVAGVPTSQQWDGIAVFLCGHEDSPPVVEARQRLAAMTGPFRPQLVRVVGSIPRGPSGKPLRGRLTEVLAAPAR
jgi:acyl-CoA synthetase (AMP-forming)/AMP-acid ligase II